MREGTHVSLFITNLFENVTSGSLDEPGRASAVRVLASAQCSARPFGLSPRFTVPSRRSRLTPIETFEDEDADETDSPLLRRGPPCTSAPDSPSAIGWLLNENQRWRDGTQEFEVKRASE